MNAHVARFVAWGKQAGHLVSGQPWNYAFGRGSALERFVDLDGKILLLGCDHDTVTFLHYAEHIVDVPDKRVARYLVPVIENGAKVWREMEEFDTSDKGAHASWPSRFFARITDGYLDATGNGGGLVGDARCFLLDARGLLDVALRVMRETADIAGKTAPAWATSTPGPAKAGHYVRGRAPLAHLRVSQTLAGSNHSTRVKRSVRSVRLQPDLDARDVSAQSIRVATAGSMLAARSAGRRLPPSVMTTASTTAPA